MSSRLIINGRAWQSRDYKPVAGPPLMPRGKELAIDPKSQPQLIPAAGEPFKDREDDVTYRVVSKLNLNEGWCLDEQLTKRYGIDYKLLLRLVRAGLIDAAMEQGSPTKRFRVRDDQKIRARLHEWGERVRTFKKKADLR